MADQKDDFLHSMRFHVTAGSGFLDKVEAGFSMVTTPELTIEVVEYKEGTSIYRKKYPGNASVNDLTMSRGVTRGDTTFWHWVRRVVEGSGEYRTDLQIKHYHRKQALTRALNDTSTANLTKIPSDVLPARVYHIYNGFPARVKVAGDLDASASEISIAEMDIAYEYFEVEEIADT